MSFIRGNDCYVHESDNEEGTSVHIWHKNVGTFGDDQHAACGWDAGVCIPRDTFDEIVVMRFAELRRDGLVRKARTRALARHRGNGGADALEYQMERRGDIERVPEGE